MQKTQGPKCWVCVTNSRCEGARVHSLLIYLAGQPSQSLAICLCFSATELRQCSSPSATAWSCLQSLYLSCTVPAFRVQQKLVKGITRLGEKQAAWFCEVRICSWCEVATESDRDFNCRWHMQLCLAWRCSKAEVLLVWPLMARYCPSTSSCNVGLFVQGQDI